MARTLINGTEQILSGSIPWAAMASGAIVPTASLVDGSKFLWKDGSVTMTASLNLGGFNATNSAAPSASTDLANKAYVDAKTGGIGGFHTVRILGAANVSSLSGLSAIDGVTPVAGDVILLIAQTTGSQNGPWTAAVGAWTRPVWWGAATVVNEGQYFIVAEGTTYKDTKFFCTTVGTITVDTTSTAFAQDTSGVTYTNGTGLSLTGNVFAVLYGTTSTTAAVGNDSRITGALQTSALGTGVQTALGVNVGTAGAFVVNGGALGTPSSGTLTSCSGLPISSGVSGLGTGVATALAITAGTGSGFALLSSGVLTAGEFPTLTGDVTTTGGSLATTINHTSGSGFVKYTDFVTGELPTGTINGSNTTFTLANTPATGNGAVSTLELFYGGELLKPGAGNDYTLSGSTITMLFAPTNSTNGNLTACYMK
jgi:hypothetical protein